MGTRRKTLRNSMKTSYYKDIDMEAVYEELDAGKTITAVAKELGVCRQTLYTRHKQYQKSLEPISLKQRLLESTDPRAEYIRKYHPEYLED